MDPTKTLDLQKARTWQKIIREASRSSLSIREFCHQRRLKERQFYLWQRRLKDARADKMTGHGQPTFALVSEDPGELASGIELVLRSGVRIRIGRGVDEATLRTVLATADPKPC